MFTGLPGTGKPVLVEHVARIRECSVVQLGHYRSLNMAIHRGNQPVPSLRLMRSEFNPG